MEAKEDETIFHIVHILAEKNKNQKALLTALVIKVFPPNNLLSHWTQGKLYPSIF